MRRIAQLTLAFYLLQTILWIAPAQAAGNVPLAPAAGASAGQRPILDAARNGVPIVHIAPPSAAGVSRNQYDKFNVGEAGLILNNSAANTQTQLGGWIGGNLQLGRTPARIILNEVVSNNPSALRGTIEVAGRRAEIVVANPNGIVCEGCGFLNTARATLTTGTPLFGARGALTGFDVRQGQLTVGADGLNASNIERLDLLARGLVLEGEVWAQNLNVLAGANRVLYASLAPVPQTGTGAAPRFALDIRDLGGMVANQIFMVATEAGLGVNSSARMVALQGNLTLSVNGELTLKDTYAKQDMSIAAAGNATLVGQTVTDGALRIAAGGQLTQAGEMDAGGPLTLALGALDNSGVIAGQGAQGLTIAATGDVTNRGTVFSAGALTLNAAKLRDQGGVWQSVDTLALTAGSMALADTQVAGGRDVALVASGGDLASRAARVSAGGTLAAQAVGHLDNTNGLWQSAGDMQIAAQSLTNSGGILLANGALQLEVAQRLDNTDGRALGAQSLTLHAGELINAGTALIASDGAATLATGGAIGNRGGVLSAKTALGIEAGGAFDNTNGIVVANDAVRVAATQLANVGGQVVARGQSGGALELKLDDLDNRQGLVSGGADVAIAASGTLTNGAGQIVAGMDTAAPTGRLRIAAGELDNAGGRIVAREQLQIDTDALRNDAAGVLAATAGDVAIHANSLSNRGGRITASGAGKIDTGALDNANGEISADTHLSIDTHGQRLSNIGGRLLAGQDLTLATGALINTADTAQSAALIASGGALDIQAASLENAGSRIVANGADSTAAVHTQTLDNANGQIAAANTLNLSAERVINTQGALIANRNLVLNANSIDNTAGLISGVLAANIALTGELQNTRGQIVTDGDLSLHANTIDNTQGLIRAGAVAQLGAASLRNADGLIMANDLRLEVDALDNHAGQLVAQSALRLISPTHALDNTGGLLQSGGLLDLTLGSLANHEGRIIGSGAVRVTTSGAIDNAQGQIIALAKSDAANSGELTLDTQGAALTNNAGSIVSDGTLTLTAGALSNRAGGQIAAATDAQLNLDSLDTTGGTLTAGRDLGLKMSGALHLSEGTLQAARDLTLVARELSQDAAATLAAGRALKLDVKENIDNAGTLIGGASLALTAGSLNNAADGRIVTAGEMTLASQGAIDNQGRIDAGAKLSIAAQSLTNQGGAINTDTDLLLTAGTLTNDTRGAQAGLIAAGQTLTLGTGALTNHGSLITGAGATQLTTRALDNAGGEISSGSTLALDTQGERLTNTGGRILAQTDLTLNAGVMTNEANEANAAATIESGAALTLRAATLTNSASQVRSGTTLALTADHLENAGLLESGSTLALTAGTARNAGEILAATDLTAKLGSLDNAAGRIAANQTLSLAARGTLGNADGQILANEAVSLAGANLDNTRGQIGSLAAARIALDAATAGTLTNTQGLISAQSLDLTTGQTHNGGGRIEAEAALTFDTAAHLLDNAGGSIQAGTTLALKSGALANMGGEILAGGALNIASAALDNSAGTLSAGATARLDTAGQALTNRGGRIVAEDVLTLVAGTLDNDRAAPNSAGGLIASNAALQLALTNLANGAGTLQALGDIKLATSGSASNGGGSLLAGHDLLLDVGTLDNAKGQMAAGHNLTAHASGTLANAGVLQADNDIALSGANIKNDSGFAQANGALTASSQNISNRSGTLGAGNRLSLSASTFDNSGGSVLANAETQISATNLINDNGTLAAGQRLDIASGQVSNRGGRIVGTNTLAINSGALDNTHGLIGSQGAVQLTTNGQSLTNDNGTIQSVGTLDLNAGALSNRAGTLAAGNTLSATVTALDNTGGTLSAGSTLKLTSNTLANADGVIESGGDTHLAIANFTNTASGRISANNDLDITTPGALNNAGGSLIAGRNLTLAGSAIDNTGGTAAAINGTLALDTRGGALTNDKGRLQAGGDITIKASDTHNQGGLIGGANVKLTTTKLDNSAGQILATQALTADTQELSNAGGLIQAQGALALDTHGNTLSNTESGAGGIVAGGALTLVASQLTNTGGYIGSGGAMTLTATDALDNSAGGKIASSAELAISAPSIDNQGGNIAALHDIALNATNQIDNRAGSIAANGNVKLTTDTFENSAGGLVDANDITLAAQTLNNAGGTLRAGNDATIAVQHLDNRAGNITAGNIVTLTAPDFTNEGGTVIGNNGVILSTQTQAPGGTIASPNAVTLNVAGDFTNTGLLSARNTLTVNAENIANSGTLHADGTFSAHTGNLSNTGEISAANTQLDVRGTLANSGLIDGTQTTLAAATLDNTGRIYGDGLQIQTATLTNTGTLAARDSLFVNAGSVSNTGGALIYAAHDIAMNGQSLLNASSRIEAGGNVSLAVSELINRNDSLQTSTQVTTSNPGKTLIQPNGSTKKYDASELGWDGSYKKKAGGYVLPSDEYPIAVYGGGLKGAATSGGFCVAHDGSAFCTPLVVNYSFSDPIWALFKVPPPDFSDLHEPTLPPGQGGCFFGHNEDFTRLVANGCSEYWTAYDSYHATADQRTNAALNALDAQIDRFNDSVYARTFEHWNEYQVTSRTISETILTSSAPAQILAGGAISIQGGGAKINDNSQIVAGGAIAISGSEVQNIAVQGLRTTLDKGQVRTRSLEYHGGFRNNYSVEYTGWTSFTNAPTSETLSVSSLIYQEYANNASAGTGPGASGTRADTSAAPAASGAQGNTREGTVAAITASTGATRMVTQNGQSLVHSVVSGPSRASVTAVETLPGASTQIQVASSVSVTAHAAQLKQIQIGATPSIQIPASTVANVAAPGARSAATTPPVVQSVTAKGSDEYARDVVLTLVPRLALPASNLFVIHPEPGQRYLVETDPRFTNQKTFLASDYFLAQLNRDPERSLKRLGDGFYEQQLVSDAILALTGRRYLDGYNNTEIEYMALMNAGVAFARDFRLTPGAALTADQMAQLTTDIVWLTTQNVELADGTTQEVLVPQVYLRRPQSGDLQASGALISGSDIMLTSAEQITNSGTLAADRRTTLVAGGDFVNAGGKLRGQNLLVQAGNDLKNLGGTIQAYGPASQLALLAGRDIVLQTTTQTNAIETATNTASRTNIDRIAVVAGGSLALVAGRDIAIRGASLAATDTGPAGGDLIASAGGQIVITPIKEHYELAIARGGFVEGRTAYSNEASTTNHLARISATRDLTLVAQSDLQLIGANVIAGRDAQLAGTNVTIAATKDSASAEVQNLGRNSYSHVATNDETLARGGLAAKGNLTINAGAGDIRLSGAQIEARGALAASAAKNIVIESFATDHAATLEYANKQRGAFSSSSSKQKSRSEQTLATGSTVSAGSIAMRAGQDMHIAGSALVADGDVALDAGGRITIDTATESYRQQHAAEQHSSGFGGAGASIGFNATQQTNAMNADGIINQGSVVGSIAGNVHVQAKGDLSIQGSDLIAAENLELGGRNVDIESVINRSQYSNEQTYKTSGISIGFSGPIIDTLQAVAQDLERSSEVSDERLKRLYETRALVTAYAKADDIQKSANQIQSGDMSSVGIKISVGSSKSESRQSSQAATAQGSAIQAGGAVRIAATGSLNADGIVEDGSGNLGITGSAIGGKTVALTAANDVTIQSATSTASENTSNSNSGWKASVGISLGQQTGFTVSASGYKGSGKSAGSGTTQLDTQVSGTEGVSIKSGRDTTLAGVQVRGEAIDVEVGRNLAILSRQDTSAYVSEQKQMSAGASFTYGPTMSGSANFNITKSNAEGSYASVVNQSGLFSGAGGYAVQVGGNTHLAGAAITSTAAPQRNVFSTDTLSVENIENHATSRAQSSGFGFDTNMLSGSTYAMAKGALAAIASRASKSSHDASTSVSVISEGTLDVRSGNSAEVGKLQRDTTGANRTLAKTDVVAMQIDTQQRSEAGTVMAGVATTLTDKAYEAMFTKPSKIYRVVCQQEPCTYDKGLVDAEGKTANPNRMITVKNDAASPDSKIAEEKPNIVLVEVTPEQLAKMSNEEKKGLVVATNGILNDLQRAGELAIQNTDTRLNPQEKGDSKKPVLLVNSPYTGNAISDLMVAGYEKFLAPVFGYTNPDYQVAATLKEAATQRDANGNAIGVSKDVTLLGHSRGTIVEVNALNILKAQGGVSVAGVSLDANALSVMGKGPAVSQGSLNAAYRDLVGNTDTNVYAAYSAFANDPVSTFIGKAINRDRGAAIKEIPAMISSPSSAHSCYGTGAAGCVQIEKPYSYQGLDLDELQIQRQERVDALLKSGQPAKSEATPIDPLNLGQQQIERYRQLQNATPVPMDNPNRLDAAHDVDPRIQQLEDFSTQLEKEHRQ